MKKINIAELLKDCPKGMELDCVMYEDVFFDKITNDSIFPIRIKRIDGGLITFTKYGAYANCPYSKCVIFPKGKTTWEGFQRPFKDGDVVYTSLGNIALLTDKQIDECYSICCILIGDTFETTESFVHPLRLATDDEKEKLFKAIKDNGYHWNAETKTLEKLVEPKFKVGDIVQDENRYKVKITEVNIDDKCYEYESMIVKGIGGIAFNEQDDWELVPNKFDITTLKPFDKVLVRYNKDNKWCGSFFSHIDKEHHSHCYKYVTTAGKSYPYCIPFEGNEHLLGTTNDCNDFCKTWE